MHGAVNFARTGWYICMRLDVMMSMVKLLFIHNTIQNPLTALGANHPKLE